MIFAFLELRLLALNLVANWQDFTINSTLGNVVLPLLLLLLLLEDYRFLSAARRGIARIRACCSYYSPLACTWFMPKLTSVMSSEADNTIRQSLILESEKSAMCHNMTYFPDRGFVRTLRTCLRHWRYVTTDTNGELTRPRNSSECDTGRLIIAAHDGTNDQDSKRQTEAETKTIETVRRQDSLSVSITLSLQ